MSTGTEIIQDGLKRIGAHSIVQPAAPETIIEGMDILNSMLQLWASWGIDIQFVPLNIPGDELSEPVDARNAIIDNLALAMAADFDNGENVVSQRLLSNANNGWEMIKTLYQTFTIPKKRPSSTLPRGAGNSKGNWTEVFFRDRRILSENKGHQTDGGN